MSREEKAKYIQSEMKQRTALVDQFKPGIQEHYARIYNEFTPPWYAAFRGQRASHYRAAAEQAAMMLVMATKRAPTEAEAAGLADMSNHRLDRWSQYKWAMGGVAGYFTYRNHQVYRFPFLKSLTYTGRYSPGQAPQLRFAWHLARFVAYYCVTWIMVDPIYLAVDTTQSLDELKKDDRLKGLRQAILSSHRDSEQTPSQNEDTPYGDAQTEQSYSDTSYEQSSISSSSGSTPLQSSWSRQAEPVGNQEKDPWSGYSANDDASPIAEPERGQSNAKPFYGSSWDRIRSQAGSQKSNTNAQQASSSWGSGSQSQDSWGSSQDSSSGWNSGANGQRNAEKDEAQKRFDELVDRERSGESGKGGWGGR
jgi:hypothetical protein